MLLYPDDLVRVRMTVGRGERKSTRVMDFKQQVTTFWLFMAISLGAICLAGLSGDLTVFGVVAAVFCTALVLFKAFGITCPKCGRSLGHDNFLSIKHCSKCGEKIA